MLRDFTKGAGADGKVLFRGDHLAPGAGQSQIQLFNPVASGVTLYLFRLVTGSSAGGIITFRRFTGVAAWALQGSGWKVNDLSAEVGQGKVYGRVDSVLEGAQRSILNIPANAPVLFDFRDAPLVIPPGVGVGVGQASAVGMDGEFLWGEV